MLAQPEVQLRLMIRMLGAWKNPLQHLMTEMSTLKDTLTKSYQTLE